MSSSSSKSLEARSSFAKDAKLSQKKPFVFASLSSLPRLPFLVTLFEISLTPSHEQGRPHYVEGADSDEEGWFQMLKVSLSRPLKFLFTEPIVTALSLAIGFVWGEVFLAIGAVSHVFAENYGFNQGTSHTVLICGFIGAAIGCLTNLFIQDPMYKRAVVNGGGRAKPEVRLYSAGVGSILFSVSLFCFAWT